MRSPLTRACRLLPRALAVFGGNVLGGPRSKLEAAPIRLIEPVSVFVKDGILFVDATLFTRENFKPFQVKHNQYDNLPPGWDVNSTSNILEVVNDARSPVLQIIYKSDSEVEINGVFVAPDQITIASPNGLESIPIKAGTTMQTVIADKIKRIFKYPSAQYPGVYE